MKFAADPEVVGPNAKAAVAAMKDGDVILLENTRYQTQRRQRTGKHSARILHVFCDVFVNDAFGTAHRAHCSNVGVTQICGHSGCWIPDAERDRFPWKRSQTIRRDLSWQFSEVPKCPAKISVINNLLDKVDTLIIGGGMCLYIRKSSGMEIGKSLL